MVLSYNIYVMQGTNARGCQYYFVNLMELGPVMYPRALENVVLIFQKLKMVMLLIRTGNIFMAMKLVLNATVVMPGIVNNNISQFSQFCLLI